MTTKTAPSTSSTLTPVPPSSSASLAETMIHASETVIRAAEAAHPTPTPALALRLLLAGSPSTRPRTEALTRTPDGRLVVPILLSAPGFELLSCAAARSGWSLSAFILDAAVCRAQDIRTECEHRHIEFADLSNVEPPTAATDLRRTHGKNGIPELAAIK